MLVRYLIIDANAFLAFYRFSADDLKELRKLEAMLGTHEVELYLTDQIRDEVLRNREKIILESLKVARDAKLPSAFPQMIRNYKAFAKLDAARRDYAKHLDALVSRTQQDALKNALHADKLLDLLLVILQWDAHHSYPE